MGKTGNKIKDLELRIVDLERLNVKLLSRYNHLQAMVESLDRSIQHLELDLKSLKEI